MKPITLHPVSVLVGAAVVGLSLVLAGAAQVSWVAKPLAGPEVRLVGEIPAEWWTYVRVGDGVPLSYAVPTDQRFVLTAIENIQGDIQANGVNCWFKVQPARPGSFANDTRVVFEPGTVLTSASVADIWGYLEPVR